MARRFVRSLATVGVVAVTSWSVVFAAPTAQAIEFTPQQLAFINNGVKHAAPKVAARAAVGGAVCGGTLGIGCAAIVVLGLGMLAYDTKDIWLPWVQGKLGQAESGTGPGPTGVGQFTTTAESFDTWRSGGSAGLAVNMTYTINAGTKLRVVANCRAPDGTMYVSSFETGRNAGTSTWAGSVCSSGSSPWQIGRRIESIYFQQAAGTTATTGFADVAWWIREAPVTRVDTILTCRRPDGSTYQMQSFTDQPTDAIKVPHCEPGDTPVTISTTGTVNGVPKPQWTNVPLAPNDSESDAEYPLCAGAATDCVYRIKVDGEFCATGIADCTHWSYIFTQQPTRVECFWGPYSIGPANCPFMERAYDMATGARTITGPNTDGDPNTYSGAAPVPSRTPSSNPTPTPTPSTSSSSQPSPSVTPSSPTTITKDPLVVACTTTYDLGQVQPETVQLANKVGKLFGVSTIYGYRDPTSDRMGEHSSGLALDFMTGTNQAQGQGIADYLQTNSDTLRVRWIIWEQRIWNAERASQGWRLMEDRGSPTANHMDHVHVLIYDSTLPGVPDLSCSGDESESAGGGGCMANQPSFPSWGWIYWPVYCVLQTLFVPSAAEVQTDLDELRDAWNSHPPGSLIETIRPVLAGLGSGFDGDCLMPDFSPSPSTDLRIPCEPPGGMVWESLYAATQGFIIITTGIYLWGMVAAGVSAKATGA